jgi:glycosyltransferase involved in cell wall biosynthesis
MEHINVSRMVKQKINFTKIRFNQMKRIIIISNHSSSLINFRGHLLKTLVNKGHEVMAIAPLDEHADIVSRQLKKIGVLFKDYSLSRGSLNFLREYNSYCAIRDIIKNYKPHIVIAYTVKPVIYTGIAMRYFSEVKYYPLITGLGYGFTEGGGIKRNLIKHLMIFLYKQALKYPYRIIFQNNDDKNLFRKLKIISDDIKTNIIHGSGVDLKNFPLRFLPKKPVFLMLSRLLIDKGVREYFEAARIVKSQFPNVVFQLAGRIDSNPSSISFNELNFHIKEGFIKYLGEISSVQKSLAACRFYVLPSYREGTPRSVLEALATGRPIITTDVAGCRETVIHEKNGLLVAPRNSKSLAYAMIKLIKKTEYGIQKMGRESYILAKKKYDIEKVNKNLIDMLNL